MTATASVRQLRRRDVATLVLRCPDSSRTELRTTAVQSRWFSAQVGFNSRYRADRDRLHLPEAYDDAARSWARLWSRRRRCSAINERERAFRERGGLAFRRNSRSRSRTLLGETEAGTSALPIVGDVAFGTRPGQGASRLLRFAPALWVPGRVPAAQIPLRAVSDGPLAKSSRVCPQESRSPPPRNEP
jgi:hypothetical protein